MKCFPVEYRPEAQDDLFYIFHSVLEISQNIITAQQFTDRIYAQCEKIGDMPFGGSPRDHIKRGLRLIPFERTVVILYCIENETVWITNVIFGGKDYEALFRHSNDK